MMAGAFTRWWNERLHLDRLYRKYFRKAFPVHSTFFLGEIALFAFVILVLTGIYLAFLYEPSTAEVTIGGDKLPAAYGSVLMLNRVPTAHLIRQIHHWAAHVMIAALALHVLRIFFTGAYKKPREINWIVGLGLLGLTIFAAFVGYLLPYDQFSVTATGIGYNIAKSVPWVGDWMSRLLFAGDFPSDGTVPRFFFMHVMLIPATLIGLISTHFLILVKQKHTEPRSNKDRKESKGGRRLIGIPIWPEQGVISLSFFLVLISVVVLMGAYIPLNPIEIYGPPAPGTPVMRPDWYFLVVYGFLKLVPGDLVFTVLGGKITPETIGGVIFPASTFVVYALVPFFDRSKEPQNYMENPLRRPFMTSLGVGAIVFLCMMVVAGYIDVLHITPKAMIAYALVATAAAWSISYMLLRWYNGKRGH